MRLLLFNYEFPPIGGGAGRASAEIAHHLGLFGHEVRVVTAGWDQYVEEEEISKGVRIMRLPCLREKIYSSTPLEMLSYVSSALRALPKILAEHPADLILSFFGVPSGIVGAKAAKQLKCPHVISLRGMDVPGYDRHNLKGYHLWLGHWILRLWKNSQHLIANSHDLRAKALAYAREKRVLHHLPALSVIGNGVNPLGHVPAKPKNLQLLCVGRFAKQKGHLLLLDMLGHPSLQQLPWQLDLVGEGSLRSLLERKIKALQLTKRVHLTGWLSPDELRLRYEQSHIFLLPSQDEGMSNALLEAMSHQLVPIATAVGGNVELIENEINGFLVRAGNPNDLRTNLMRCIDMWQKKPQDFVQLGKQASQSVRARSWSVIARQYEQVLTNVLFLAGTGSTVTRDAGETGFGVAAEINHERFLKRPAQKTS